MLSKRAYAETADNTTLLDAPPADSLRSGPDLEGEEHLATVETGAPSVPTLNDQNRAALEGMLLRDEQRRAHGFSAAIGLIAAGVFAALPTFGGDPAAKRLYTIAVAIIAVQSLWVWRATAKHREYELWVARVYTTTIALCTTSVVYYVGVFSPVVAVVTLGVYYIGQSADPFQSLVLPLYMIAMYTSLAIAMTAGFLPDLGLFSAVQASLSSHMFGVIAGGGVLLLTLYLARISRASMKATVEGSFEAMLAAKRREALLAEARQNLERALDVAIGKPGHSTGRRAGPYLLDVVIGIGAMGEVYSARDTGSGQSAAVKLLHAEAEQRPDLVERFLREGEILQGLKSPNLVEVFGVGQLDTGAPYMAMELLRGNDLATMLRKRGHLTLDEVVGLADALAGALEQAHDARVIHRDLKPSNVFQCAGEDKRRSWKVLDFGISKLQTAEETLTHHRIVGTPSYMSPEQSQGKNIDHRSDIFSMAVVLYRALTGRPAFAGNDAPQVLFEVVYKTPERPSAIIKYLPFDVDFVFAIGLSKDPDQRWQSASEFAEALKAASTRGLSVPLRVRAAAIIRANPWGRAIPHSMNAP